MVGRAQRKNRVSIERLAESNVDAVVAFFDRLNEGDLTFFKEPVAGERTVRGWLADDRGTRLLAFDGDEVVGYAAVIEGVGWSSHVGELRLVIDPSRRRQGLGHRLAAAALVTALEAGLSKVVVEAVATQDATIALFTKLGFVPEALLEDHVRDASGQLNDLIVLAHHSADTWATLATVGLDTPLD
jgi:ribosomal protein S18 acetylase RimI-like enzyme